MLDCRSSTHKGAREWMDEFPCGKLFYIQEKGPERPKFPLTLVPLKRDFLNRVSDNLPHMDLPHTGREV
jgi:hypothetical protein